MARPGPLPAGDYSFELKWGGFRALVARKGDFRVRSRRGWDMTALLPELADLPADGVFGGELVAFADGVPYFPLVCERLLHGHRDVALTFVVFDVLELDGEVVMDRPCHRDVALTFVVFDVLELDGEVVMDRPFAHRRRLLDELELRLGPWFVADALEDGAALYTAACERGLEGVVAKRRLERYRPRERGWIKVKNPWGAQTPS